MSHIDTDMLMVLATCRAEFVTLLDGHVDDVSLGSVERRIEEIDEVVLRYDRYYADHEGIEGRVGPRRSFLDNRMCLCGHAMAVHFRWDGRASICRWQSDGSLARGGSEAECWCRKAVAA